MTSAIIPFDHIDKLGRREAKCNPVKGGELDCGVSAKQAPPFGVNRSFAVVS